MKNKKIFIKLISTLLLISLLTGIGGTALFKPKPARAVIPVIDWLSNTKETILDTALRVLAKIAVQKMVSNISQWARGGFRDDNQPFAITNWADYLKTAVDVGSSMFISEFGLTELCLPFRDVLGRKLGLGAINIQLPTYQYYAACTIGDIVNNAQEFWKNPSIAMYGWGSWTALSQPQNNIYGSFLLGAERRAELEDQEREKKEKEGTTSGGYRSDVICTKTDKQECMDNCSLTIAEDEPEFQVCINNCERATIGTCIQEQLKTTGSEIHATLEKAIGADIDWILGADEIAELLGAFITGIITRLTTGPGLYDYQAPSDSYSPPITPPSLAEQQRIIDQTREGIFESIKQLAQNINQTDSESQLLMAEIGDILFTVFEQQTIQFYSAMEGTTARPGSVIPDKYPLQIAEWISQAAVEYPLVAKTNICIGGPVRVMTTTCQPVLDSEIDFPGSCLIASIDPDCADCFNPSCLLTFAAIESYSRFCEALSLDDSWCERGTIIISEPYCGDGIKDLEEQCDDGNTIDGDGCSATCQRERGRDGR